MNKRPHVWLDIFTINIINILL